MCSPGCHVTGEAAPFPSAARGRRDQGSPRAFESSGRGGGGDAGGTGSGQPRAHLWAPCEAESLAGRGSQDSSGQSKMAGILAWFWNERFWLPHNVTWADLKNTEEATFPQAEDLYLAFPLAFCIFMVRLLFER